MKRIRKIFIVALAVIAIVCAFTAFSAFAADGDATLKNASEFKTDGAEWAYGQTIARPTGELEYNGETKTADVIVVFPDGTESKGAGDLLKLDEEGKYTVIYQASFGGETRSATDYFTIEKDLFFVSSAASSAKYYNYVYAEHASAGYSSARDSMKNSSVSGVYVSIAPGDTFTYSRVIDVSGLTANDMLIKMVIAPERIGIKDVSDFTITLTDAYDPTNYISIKTNWISDVPLVYMSAAASNGQQFTGFNYNSGSKYVNTSYGTPMRFSLNGPCLATESTDTTVTSPTQNDVRYGINEIKDNRLSISFDAATLQIHNKESYHCSSTSMIVDFDDPTHFEKVWGGFTTGECFLSVKGGAYVGDTFNFMITDIYGVGDMTDAANAEDYFTFSDRGTLDVIADIGRYEEDNLPQAKVGVKYPVFTASALNQYYGRLNATYTVKKDVETVAENGQDFVPASAGDYVITYIVKDYFGKTAEKSLTITAVAETAPISFDLVGFDAIAETAEIETTGVAGRRVKLNDAVNFAGGCANGVFDVETEVKLGSEVFEITDGTFFPTKAGNYVITVKLTDYIGQSKTETYEIRIAAGDKPVFVEKPNLPKFFISGRKYILPAVNAYDYTDGSGRIVATKIAYADGEGIKRAIGRTIMPVINEIKSDVDIIYYTDTINSADDFSGNLVFRNLPAVDAGQTGVDFTKLFIADGISLTAKASSTTLKAVGDGTAELVNALGANGLVVRFQGKKGACAYDAFTITLTDSENADQSVKFFYIPGASNSTLFKINSLSALEYKAEQSITEGDALAIEINTTGGSVKFDRNSNVFADIHSYINGKEFNGFDSGKVYVKLGFEGVKSSAEVELVSIAGQRISAQTTDRIAPRISIEGEYLGYVDFGKNIRIPKAIITDVVDPAVEGVVTVEMPEDSNGKRSVAVSSDGVFLKNAAIDRDYTVKATAYGTYLVSFRAQDYSGNPLEYQYYVNVVDGTAPVITVEEKTVTGKVGANITVPKATATDNLDGEVKIVIYVLSPSGTMYMLKENEYTFTTNAAGKYKIMYIARDAAGNTGVKTVEITVGA